MHHADGVGPIRDTAKISRHGGVGSRFGIYSEISEPIDRHDRVGGLDHVVVGCVDCALRLRHD